MRYGLLIVALVACLVMPVDGGVPVRLRPIDELKPLATIHLGATADWVAITDDAVWVGSTGPFAIHRIEPRTNQLAASVPLPGEPCAGLAAGFGSIWVPLCTKPASLARVDAKSNSLTTVFKIGPAAEEGGIAVSDDSVWLVTDAKGMLSRIDPVTGKVRQRVQVPAGSYNPTYSGGRIWLTRADGAELTSIDASTGAVIGTAATGQGPRFLTAGAGAVWTLNQRAGTVTRVDAGDRSTSTIPLGLTGHGGDVDFADGLVWITLRRVPLLAVDSQSRTLLCEWIGAGGDSLRIGHDAIWLTDYSGGTVTRYDLRDASARCRSQSHGLVGAWQLVQFEDRSVDGIVKHPFGDHPRGQLIYDDAGHMSIQIMKMPHPGIASGDDEKVRTDEKIALYDAYVAYFGSYRVDAGRRVVIHEVTGDLADVYVGKAEERPFELDGNRLTLHPRWVSDGKQWEGLRVFERR